MPLNPSRRSGEPRSAALVPATDVRAKMRTASSSGERWQRQVIKYDREGPGILGYYLDTVGLDMGWLVVFDVRPDRSWEERLWSRALAVDGKTVVVLGA